MTHLEQKIHAILIDQTFTSEYKAKQIAKIALELAQDSYDQGRIDQCNYECGRGNGSFKQFIEDYFGG